MPFHFSVGKTLCKENGKTRASRMYAGLEVSAEEIYNAIFWAFDFPRFAAFPAVVYSDSVILWLLDGAADSFDSIYSEFL
jgi:hypothetical protein